MEWGWGLTDDPYPWGFSNEGSIHDLHRRQDSLPSGPPPNALLPLHEQERKDACRALHFQTEQAGMSLAEFQMLIFVLLDHNYISQKNTAKKKNDCSLEVRFIVPFCPLSASSRGLVPHWACGDLLFRGSQRGHGTAFL